MKQTLLGTMIISLLLLLSCSGGVQKTAQSDTALPPAPEASVEKKADTEPVPDPKPAEKASEQPVVALAKGEIVAKDMIGTGGEVITLSALSEVQFAFSLFNYFGLNQSLSIEDMYRLITALFADLPRTAGNDLQVVRQVSLGKYQDDTDLWFVISEGVFAPGSGVPASRSFIILTNELKSSSASAKRSFTKYPIGLDSNVFFAGGIFGDLLVRSSNFNLDKKDISSFTDARIRLNATDLLLKDPWKANDSGVQSVLHDAITDTSLSGETRLFARLNLFLYEMSVQNWAAAVGILGEAGKMVLAKEVMDPAFAVAALYDAPAMYRLVRARLSGDTTYLTGDLRP